MAIPSSALFTALPLGAHLEFASRRSDAQLPGPLYRHEWHQLRLGGANALAGSRRRWRKAAT